MIECPELFFGIAGPIGVDVDSIVQTLGDELYRVRYDSRVIRLTALIKDNQFPQNNNGQKDYFSDITSKIEQGNALCIKYDASALARLGIQDIRSVRQRIIKDLNDKSKDKNIFLPERMAYIIRQLKRPDEVELLRKVYGKQFILISAYGSIEDRRSRIEEKIRNSISTLILPSEITAKAEKLMERDASEEDESSGQQLRETFHMADVFIDGISKPEMSAKLGRFIQALFGRLDISPTKEEYGMYAAKSASLRSADLSRQVGAAIFSKDGELITQGCNEVPKALGGTYWDTEEPDYRDIKLGYDPNNSARNHLLRDLFERLQKHDLLSKKAIDLGGPTEIMQSLTKKAGADNGNDGALVGSKVMDLTEFGRVVHAEMCAVCDAARLGKSVKGATLFCTTFPCHNCAKHIIASGIKKVVYMEPYPKSLASQLHKNEISIEEDVDDKVSFMPFLGISPFRYRDIFQKGKRKRSDGSAHTWMNGCMRPMIDVSFPSYPDAEEMSVAALFTDFQKRDHATE